MSLGQSSIEYLTTYGWMVLAASLAAGTTYPTLQRGCDVQLQNDITNTDLNVDQAGVTENGSFEIVLDSNTQQDILVESVKLANDDESLEIVNPAALDPGGTIVYPVGEVKKTGSCQEYTMDIIFNKGPLQGQHLNLAVKGSLNLIESFASLIRIPGDSVSTLEIDTSVHPSNDTLCIGHNCAETQGDPNGSNEYVDYKGDEMTGYLKANEIDTQCFGKKCPTSLGKQDGYADTRDGEVNGTLNMTELKPLGPDDPVLDLR